MLCRKKEEGPHIASYQNDVDAVHKLDDWMPGDRILEQLLPEVMSDEEFSDDDGQITSDAGRTNYQGDSDEVNGDIHMNGNGQVNGDGHFNGNGHVNDIGHVNVNGNGRVNGKQHL